MSDTFPSASMSKMWDMDTEALGAVPCYLGYLQSDSFTRVSKHKYSVYINAGISLILWEAFWWTVRGLFMLFLVLALDVFFFQRR